MSRSLWTGIWCCQGYWGAELSFHSGEEERWLRQLADATMMEGGCSFRCSSVPEDGYSTLSLMFINIVLWVRNLPQIVSFVLKKTVLERW